MLVTDLFTGVSDNLNSININLEIKLFARLWPSPARRNKICNKLNEKFRLFKNSFQTCNYGKCYLHTCRDIVSACIKELRSSTFRFFVFSAIIIVRTGTRNTTENTRFKWRPRSTNHRPLTLVTYYISRVFVVFSCSDSKIYPAQYFINSKFVIAIGQSRRWRINESFTALWYALPFVKIHGQQHGTRNSNFSPFYRTSRCVALHPCTYAVTPQKA